MLKTFRGGFHVPDCKTGTNAIPIKEIEGAPVHIFPLHQHIGVELDIKVEVGQYVKVGDVLADADAFLAVPVHSSVSGTVTDIKKCVNPSGSDDMAVYVENDFKYEVCDDIEPKSIDAMTKEEILGVIRNAGIVGMGGAGFPTHAKLSPPKEKKITHMIINAAECEPYLTSDHRRLLESPQQVMAGLRFCLKLLDLDKGYIAIEANKLDAAEVLDKFKDEKIEIVRLKTKYPQGSEKQLIKAVTGKSVPSGGLPADAGAIVINVDTAYAIAEAFMTGMPVVDRIVTVAGDCIKNPANFKVRIGTPFEFIIEKAGGFSKDAKKIISGGPMMGIAQYTLSVPTIKTTSAILALSDAADIYDSQSPCIRCGRCVSHCPMHLMPLNLSKFADEGDIEMCEKYHIMDCIECGLCSYICPGKQNILQKTRVVKQKIREQRRNK